MNQKDLLRLGGGKNLNYGRGIGMTTEGGSMVNFSSDLMALTVQLQFSRRVAPGGEATAGGVWGLITDKDKDCFRISQVIEQGLTSGGVLGHPGRHDADLTMLQTQRIGGITAAAAKAITRREKIRWVYRFRLKISAKLILSAHKVGVQF